MDTSSKRQQANLACLERRNQIIRESMGKPQTKEWVEEQNRLMRENDIEWGKALKMRD